MKKHTKVLKWIFLWWLFLIFLFVIFGLLQTDFGFIEQNSSQKQNDWYFQTKFFSNTGTIEPVSSELVQNEEWYLEIPKIHINQKIEEGTTKEVLKKAIGHFVETPFWEGNIGLAAHNRNGGEAGFFCDLKKLEEGDEIIYHKNGENRVYQVESNCIIAETDWSYLDKTKENQITLITCEEGMKEYRRCVQAHEKEEIENENENKKRIANCNDISNRDDE